MSTLSAGVTVRRNLSLSANAPLPQLGEQEPPVFCSPPRTVPATYVMNSMTVSDCSRSVPVAVLVL